MSNTQPKAGEIWISNDFKDPYVIIHSTIRTVLIVEEEWPIEEFKRNFTLYRDIESTRIQTLEERITDLEQLHTNDGK